MLDILFRNYLVSFINLDTSNFNNFQPRTSHNRNSPNQNLKVWVTDCFVSSIDESHWDQQNASFRLNHPPLSPIPASPYLDSTHYHSSNTLSPNSSTTIHLLLISCILDPVGKEKILSSRIDQTPTQWIHQPISTKTRRRHSHADNFALRISPKPSLKHLHIKPFTHLFHKNISTEKKVL